MPPSRSSSRQNDVIQVLAAANIPPSTRRITQSAPSGQQRQSLWKRTGQHATPARSRSALNPDDATKYEGLDAEGIRTRKYWEKYAKTATKELLKDNRSKDTVHENLMYSGKVGIQPKYAPYQSDSESDDTDITLLTCSQISARVFPRKRRLRSRNAKKKVEKEPEKTDWEQFARRKNGLLDKMMRQDADTLQMYTGAKSGALNQVSDLMSEEERAMIMSCAAQRGLSSKDKSFSTENLSTGCGIKQTSQQRESMVGTGSSTPHSPMELRLSSGQTPSPRELRDHMRPRANSVMVFDKGLVTPAQDAVHERINDFKSSQCGKSPFSYDEPFKELLDGYTDKDQRTKEQLDARIRYQMRAQVDSTVSALDRFTGYGDHQSEMNTIQEERSVYTSADYSKTPRYPQNIRVAPQLASIITRELRDRMRRPRRRDLTKHDVTQFNQHQASLDRSQRNLLIFNWLNSLSENNFETDTPPSMQSMISKQEDYAYIA